MGRFFAQHGAKARVPRLLGALQLDGPSPMTLGVVHEFIPAQGDGWGYLVEAFKQLDRRDAPLLQEIELLGRRIGELHRLLASEANDPAFAPEPLGREDLQRWSSSIVGELGVALSLASEVAPNLMDRRAPLTRRAQKLASVEPSGQKIRVHGDLHLGQVLFASGEKGSVAHPAQGGDWVIFDFEGEPLRPFSQRREKHCALKDVAGMLRSFSYAAATAELGPEQITSWIPRVREAFLRGYRTATQGTSFLPQGDSFDVVLEALELEKLLYELRYEVRHRPTWVPIPVQALLALEDRP
jgi:trehalose synthase-fused probable maltokinase